MPLTGIDIGEVLSFKKRVAIKNWACADPAYLNAAEFNGTDPTAAAGIKIQ